MRGLGRGKSEIERDRGNMEFKRSQRRIEFERNRGEDEN
jgi:hypothetical protein